MAKEPPAESSNNKQNQSNQPYLHTEKLPDFIGQFFFVI